MVDTRYFNRTEPTILGEDFMTFFYDPTRYDEDWDWVSWDECLTNRRTYEPIEDEV